jgi:hypothetical protein
MKINADGAVSEAGARSDFWAGHAFDEAKDKRFAVSVGEGADGVEDGVGFGGGVRGVRSGRSAGFSLHGRRLLVEFVGRFCAAMKVGGAITGDGSEPSRKAGNLA